MTGSPYFTPASDNPTTYVCPACDGHGGDCDGGPWVHPQSPDADWRDCATCAGLGEVDYRELGVETLDDFAWWGKAPDDMARIVAIRALVALGEFHPDGHELMTDADRASVFGAAEVAA